MNTYDVYWTTGPNINAYYEGCERGVRAENKNEAERIAVARVFDRMVGTRVKAYRTVLVR